MAGTRAGEFILMKVGAGGGEQGYDREACGINHPLFLRNIWVPLFVWQGPTFQSLGRGTEAGLTQSV